MSLVAQPTVATAAWSGTTQGTGFTALLCWVRLGEDDKKIDQCLSMNQPSIYIQLLLLQWYQAVLQGDGLQG